METTRNTTKSTERSVGALIALNTACADESGHEGLGRLKPGGHECTADQILGGLMHPERTLSLGDHTQ
ncbi:MAG: hypothetical protein RL413_73 [Actinomycetota bacterium]